jgi:hypothetical protein
MVNDKIDYSNIEYVQCKTIQKLIPSVLLNNEITLPMIHRNFISVLPHIISYPPIPLECYPQNVQVNLLKLFNWLMEKLDTTDYSTKANIALFGVTGAGKTFIKEIINTMFKVHTLEPNLSKVAPDAIYAGVLHYAEVPGKKMKDSYFLSTIKKLGDRNGQVTFDVKYQDPINLGKD